MGKGVQVKYHSFNENGMDMIYERTVYKVCVLTIPTTTGDIDYLCLGTEKNGDYTGQYPLMSVMIPPDDLNFVEFAGKTYHLRNISDLNICCNDIKTELELSNVD